MKFSEILNETNNTFQFQKTLVEKVNEHQRSLLQMEFDIESRRKNSLSSKKDSFDNITVQEFNGDGFK